VEGVLDFNLFILRALVISGCCHECLFLLVADLMFCKVFNSPFFVGKRYETYFLDYVQNGGIAGKHDTILASIHSSQCFVVIYMLN